MNEKFVELVETYIQNQQTGTVMLVFSDNSMARVYLVDGVISTARYKDKQGIDALLAINGVDIATHRFHDDTDVVRSREFLTSNAEVFEALKSGVSVQTATSPPPQAPTPVPAAPAPAGPLLSLEGRARLGTLLSEYIGPVAPLVMSDLPQNIDVESAIAALVKEIDDNSRVAQFISEAKQAV